MPCRNPRTLSVIVTFNPSPDLIENASTIKAQSDGLLLIDNASDSGSDPQITAAVRKTSAHLIKNDHNLGIGKALNQAAEFALEQGYQWLATFDQDSRPDSKMLFDLHAGLKSRTAPGEIAIAAPEYFDLRTGEPLLSVHGRRAKNGIRSVKTVMTSGNLLNLSAWRQLGGFDETYFIDYVDHDFCLRARRGRFAIIEVQGARLYHQLGDLRVLHFGPLSISPSNHTVLRRYYITRNRLKTWRRHFLFDPSWVLQDLSKSASEFAKIILLESDPLDKTLAIAHGVRDAVTGVSGPRQRAKPRQ